MTMSRLPCMAVKQPYASLLVAGIKDVENRSSAMPDQLKGRWCAIYASKTLAPVGSWVHASNLARHHTGPLPSWCLYPGGRDIQYARKLCVIGAIVGLVRWESSTKGESVSPWSDYRCHHWTYSDRIVLPVPVPLPDGGCQSLYWYLSDDTVLALMTRIADTGRDIPMDVLAAWSSAGVPEREPLTDITGCDV